MAYINICHTCGFLGRRIPPPRTPLLIRRPCDPQITNRGATARTDLTHPSPCPSPKGLSTGSPVAHQLCAVVGPQPLRQEGDQRRGPPLPGGRGGGAASKGTHPSPLSPSEPLALGAPGAPETVPCTTGVRRRRGVGDPGGAEGGMWAGVEGRRECPTLPNPLPPTPGTKGRGATRDGLIDRVGVGWRRGGAAGHRASVVQMSRRAAEVSDRRRRGPGPRNPRAGAGGAWTLVSGGTAEGVRGSDQASF